MKVIKPILFVEIVLLFSWLGALFGGFLANQRFEREKPSAIRVLSPAETAPVASGPLLTPGQTYTVNYPLPVDVQVSFVDHKTVIQISTPRSGHGRR